MPSHLPFGGSPNGTGESPVPPTFRTSSEVRSVNQTARAAGFARSAARLTIILLVMLAGAAKFNQAVGAAEEPAATAFHIATNTPAMEELTLANSLSQYGIRWTFAKPVRVGCFVNGDYYVVGPVVIAQIDPPPELGSEVPESERLAPEIKRIKDGKFIRNGSMLNPPAIQEVAFDSGIRNYFNPDLLAVPPIHMKPGDCLVSTISLKVGERDDFPYHGGDGPREHHDVSPVKTAAVLTCVAGPEPADAFRPSYGDRAQIIYLARNLRWGLLRQLPPPAKTPDVKTWIRIFQRPWINLGFFGFEQPMENMPHYGQFVGQAQSVGGLLLMLKLPPAEKEALAINMVQVGIDYWGLIRNGHPGWQGWGGHGSGRKFPIVLAGVLLGDEQMAAPTVSFPKAEFGEDDQTMYGHGWTGATALFAGHSGIQSATGKAERPKWGPYEEKDPSQWTKSDLQSESYRRANTSSAWVGEALAIRMLHAEKQWNHEAFFDYVDRWMTEDDAPARETIMKYWPDAGFTEKAKFSHEGYIWEPFIKTMWERYRNQLGEVK